MSDADNLSVRPLRRDAELNRQRILKAARKLITERGLQVSHDDVAREARVAVGTVYRRYPRREQLFEALFEDRIDAVVDLAEAALTRADAWDGLTSFLVGVFELQAEDRGLGEFMSRGGDTKLAVNAAARIQPVVGELVHRAHVEGSLRADVGAGDIPLIPMMVGPVLRGARQVSPDLWRRMLAIVIDGISARPQRPRLPGEQPDGDALAAILSAPPPPRD